MHCPRNNYRNQRRRKHVHMSINRVSKIKRWQQNNGQKEKKCYINGESIMRYWRGLFFFDERDEEHHNFVGRLNTEILCPNVLVRN